MANLKTLMVLALVAATAQASADTSPGPMEQAASLADELVRNISSWWGVEAPSSNDVMRHITTLSDTIATKLSGVVRTMQDEIQAHSGQMSQAMQTASTNLNRTIAALRSPENQQRVEDLRAHVSSGLQTMAREAARVKEAVAEDTQGVRSEVHEVWQEAVRAAERLSQRVQDAIQQHRAEHGEPQA
ncbi:uncharacterized protein LOC134530985 [Bacillus rossius redtenbacheri]|uniref:uncharacterized protein LOC134530985 n=1 Tax=Bacillus rossius redtenbacheri TaxID=93214 RepID=UPI002FDCB8BB